MRGSQSWKGCCGGWGQGSPEEREPFPHHALQSRAAALLGIKKEEDGVEGRGWREGSKRAEVLRGLP